MEIILLGTLAAFGSKLLDFGKFLTNKDWNAAITQLIAWVVGVIVFVVASNSSLFDTLLVPGLDVPFGDLDTGSLIFLGLNAMSVLSIGYDLKKAFDQHDSAKTPPLVTKAP